MIILTELRARGRAEVDLPPGLVEASTLGPGATDLASFFDGARVHQRFLHAAELTAGDTDHPWVEIATARRQSGRIAVLRAFVDRLERLVVSTDRSRDGVV